MQVTFLFDVEISINIHVLRFICSGFETLYGEHHRVINKRELVKFGEYQVVPDMLFIVQSKKMCKYLNRRFKHFDQPIIVRWQSVKRNDPTDAETIVKDIVYRGSIVSKANTVIVQNGIDDSMERAKQLLSTKQLSAKDFQLIENLFHFFDQKIQAKHIVTNTEDDSIENKERIFSYIVGRMKVIDPSFAEKKHNKPPHSVVNEFLQRHGVRLDTVFDGDKILLRLPEHMLLTHRHLFNSEEGFLVRLPVKQKFIDSKNEMYRHFAEMLDKREVVVETFVKRRSGAQKTVLRR